MGRIPPYGCPSASTNMPSSKGKPTDPKLREKVKEEVKNSQTQMEAGKVNGLHGRLLNCPRSTRLEEADMRTRAAQRTSRRRGHQNRNLIRRKRRRTAAKTRKKKRRRRPRRATKKIKDQRSRRRLMRRSRERPRKSRKPSPSRA